MAILILLIGALPAGRFKNAALRLVGPGWSIAPSARIQPCVLWRIGTLRIEDDARIGVGNVFRSLRSVELDEGAEIGQLNWFSAAADGVRVAGCAAPGRLLMGRRSALTSRHYVDCAGGVSLGELCLVAGVRSTILSHGLDPRTWEQEARPVELGRASAVYTNVVVTAGVTVADRAVVGAGAVVSKDLTRSEKLYGGVPAREVGDMSGAPGFERAHVRAARAPVEDDPRPPADGAPGSAVPMSPSGDPR